MEPRSHNPFSSAPPNESMIFFFFLDTCFFCSVLTRHQAQVQEQKHGQGDLHSRERASVCFFGVLGEGFPAEGHYSLTDAWESKLG